MENTMESLPKPMSAEDQIKRHYERKAREIRIARARAGVVKSQILRAYEILEGIRFDYINDTAFRDCITGAEKELEHALNDFLLRDEYWQKKIDEHHKLTPKEYDEIEKAPIVQQGELKN